MFHQRLKGCTIFNMRIFILLSGLWLAGCSSLLYYPSSQKFYDPKRLNLAYDDVYFKIPSGEKLHGWWFPAKGKSKGTIVFFHGNAENLSSHFLSLSWLPEKGFSYFIFDYPGYGESEGKPTPRGCVDAGHAAIEWVRTNKDQRPLIIYGQSLGGNIAMRSALDIRTTIPLRLVVIDSSFLSFKRIARHKLSLHWLTWLFQPIAYVVMSDKYAPENIADLAPTPLLAVHGLDDVVVEPRWGEEIFASAGEPKTFWRVEKGRHGDLFWKHDQIYRQKLMEFLQKL